LVLIPSRRRCHRFIPQKTTSGCATARELATGLAQPLLLAQAVGERVVSFLLVMEGGGQPFGLGTAGGRGAVGEPGQSLVDRAA